MKIIYSCTAITMKHFSSSCCCIAKENVDHRIHRSYRSEVVRPFINIMGIKTEGGVEGCEW